MRISLPVLGQAPEVVVGIDLGTTNSLCARVVDGKPVVVADRGGRRITPSAVAVDEEGHVTVGDDALERALFNPEGTVTSIKRFMGRGIDDVKEDLSQLPYKVVRASKAPQQLAVRVHGKEYLPQEISAFVLEEVRRRAERTLGARIRRAVITVPAYFDDAQRQATRDAGRMVNLDVLRIINEPTAAALAYGLDRSKRGTVLVYDLGGGTFDVSLLKLSEGVFKVVATTGNTKLGGDDFDRRLGELLLSGLDEEKRAAVLASHRRLRALKIAAESAKKQLSDSEEARVRLRFPDVGVDVDRAVTRAEYEAAIADLVEQTLASVRFVLDDAGLDPEDVGEVVCVGGSTRTPLVRRKLAEYFGKKPHTEIDPDEVVALGAALQAQALAGEAGAGQNVLLDVTPLSLGIETYGGGTSKVIHRNTPIPVRRSEGFTTYVDKQTAVDIHVLQGEREMASDLRSLGRFKLRGIPPMSAGMPRVLVEFFIDANGILKVTAKEMVSSQEASIEVTPTYGLSDEQVEEMILASIEHAEEDFAAHILADLKNEAGSVLRYSRKVMAERPDLVPNELRGAIDAALAGLEAAVEKVEKEAIEAAIAVLNEHTQPIAAAMMDEVLQVTVRGKTVSDVMGEAGTRTKAGEIRLS
jgi:Fe-S protein assembly chaperone HscA